MTIGLPKQSYHDERAVEMMTGKDTGSETRTAAAEHGRAQTLLLGTREREDADRKASTPHRPGPRVQEQTVSTFPW